MKVVGRFSLTWENKSGNKSKNSRSSRLLCSQSCVISEVDGINPDCGARPRTNRAKGAKHFVLGFSPEGLGSLSAGIHPRAYITQVFSFIKIDVKSRNMNLDLQ
jgi:hypothetical protein